MENIPRLQAEQQLRDNPPDPTDYESWYRLVLLATGDEKQAVLCRRRAKERLVDTLMGKK